MWQTARDTLLGLAAGAALLGLQAAGDGITADGIRAHLSFLASDRLQGRAPGSPGAVLAAEYIAARLGEAGLEPVGGAYYQDVPVTGMTTDPGTATLAFDGGDTRLAARYPEDAVIWAGAPDQELAVTGELVFVGYGIRAPEWRWDDFKGKDLTGKVLLFLVGDPPAPPEEEGLFDGPATTYYGRWSYKLEEARRRGAAGVLIIHRAGPAGYGWSVVESSWTGERLALSPDDGRPLPLRGWLRHRFADRLLARAGLDLDELAVSAARRDFRPVPTGLLVRARLDGASRAVSARNVVAYLPGRSDEVVVLNAHYDHLGVGPPVRGDSIYNGAYDNASGVGLLLEVAGALARAGPGERGILVLATTGEEAGLLGTRHYVRHPLIPLERTVAVVNIDGANLWGETDDVIAPGADRSTLGELLGWRAEEMGMDVRTDPAPERGAFCRSDHFPFARAGVPALQVQHGLRYRGRPAGWGDRMIARWMRDHYHQPSDELPANLDLSGAVQQARLIFRLTLDIANAAARPETRAVSRNP
ncbi:MAG: M28 family peptidase [Gemmatimonadota bacterium]